MSASLPPLRKLKSRHAFYREVPSDASLRDLAAAERYKLKKNRKVYYSAEEMLKALGIE